MPWWPWSRTAAYDAVETRSQWSISDPAIVDLLGYGSPAAGQNVSEQSVLGLSAVYRAVSLISGSIASLPMRTLVTNGDATERTGSFLDTPGGPNGATRFEWVEIVLVHLLTWGNAYLAHLRGGAGQLVGLLPVHPSAVSVDLQPDGSKLFTVALADGTRRILDSSQLTHIPAMSTDGVVGLSPIALARNMFSTSLAGEKSAAAMFANGAMLSGLITPLEDLTAEEATTIKADIRNRMQGTNNAGDIAVVNRKLKFDQWSMSAEDAQFLQSRAFQVEEIARFYGVPPHLLAQTEKSTSWGTGIEEQNRGLARYTFETWTTRVQERLSRLLPPNKKVEFDFTAFVQPSPEQEIPLIIAQVQAGLLTPNEGRKIRNLPPLPGGDVVQIIPTAGQNGPPTEPPKVTPLRVASETTPTLARFGEPLILPATNGANGHEH